MKIFAHRGASGYAPENTIKAFTAAIEQGVKAVELDIHLVEGELYVFHDRRLEAKSSGHGLIDQVSQHYLSTITVAGEPIATLSEVLALLKPHNIEVNIELKGLSVLPAFSLMYEQLINQQNYDPDLLLISSFNHVMLSEFKCQFPSAKIAPIIEGIPLNLAQVASELGAFSIHLGLSFVNQAMIQDAHQRGVKVYVYTVDFADDIHRLNALEVDGIFTNFPDKAMRSLEGS
ncbi:glycerophosphodiester phosphodiesterase [Shewanella youngdeokensis]|uniref:Glycerophosphodiester phosphodiesterase n=1 Tax=Shewanella youngdeokensis TaxID=2999068 RepID=A0ABZ0JWR6_9GAMM|nr:glycerophosphodiester phosphodiesterase [Shewanella sp. DAU334]